MFKRFWWVFLVMFPLGALAGLLVSGVITYLMPKMYESESVIEVKPPRETAASFNLGTELGIMGSRNSLEKVVASLDLTNRWAMDRESACQVLKRIVVFQPIKSTDLVSIRVRHTNRLDARDVVEGVVSAYNEYRREIAGPQNERMLHELKKAAFDQEDKVETCRKILSTIVKTKGIVLKDADAGIEAPNPVDVQDYVDARRDLDAAQALLQALKLKLVEQTVRASAESEGAVMHEKPMVPQVPVSPDVSRNLAAGVALGLLVSPLMALPLVGLLNRTRPRESGT